MKNAVVIGATSGIGKELAKILVKNNYKVAITGRREEKLKELKNLHPDKYIIKKHDVIDYQSSETILNELVKEMGNIDLIIYSSGVGEPNYKLDWDKEVPTIETNVMAAVKVYGLAYKLFKKQGCGHLVGISSIASIRGNRHVPAYFASKAFQANYLESLWMKGKKSKANIIVTDIQPGFVDTKMAIGTTFWMAPLEKASNQIYKAIKNKRKKAYITKRWALVAFVLKITPSSLISKFA